jgi:hypothetical protein
MMTFYRRTTKGDREIVTRESSLSQDLRNLLLLINGRRDVPALASLFPPLRVSLEALTYLEDHGFIELDLGAVVTAPAAAAANAEWSKSSSAPVVPMAGPRPVPSQPPPSAPTAPASAPIERFDYGFAARREQLMQYLAMALGPDYEPVGKRLSQTRDAAELATLEKKLVDLMRLYRGPRAAQAFAEKFRIVE